MKNETLRRRVAFLPAAAFFVLLVSGAPPPAFGQTYLAVHSFTSSEANDSQCALTGLSPETLYGTSPFGGTGAGSVYSSDYSGGVTPMHSFSTTDGANPYAGLLLNPADNFLYGVTEAGGTGSSGVVFKIDTDGNNFSVIHNLDGGNDGAHPWGALVLIDSTLYGVARDAGANGYGTIFSIGTDGSTYTPIYTFGSGTTDGSHPYGGLLVGDDGRLYGTTEQAHNGSGLGTVFAVDTTGAGFATLHTFAGGSDGQDPQAMLIEAADGFLYGTTLFGGSANSGTAYKLLKDGSVYSVFHEFAGNALEGGRPSQLIQVPNGLLYGTTSLAGENSAGTLYLMTTSGQLFTPQHQFATASGATPYGGVFFGDDRNLYGTTATGGLHDAGVLFQYTIPTIANFPTPSSGPASGGTSVTISGAAFQPGATVTFGGSQSPGPSVSATSITASAPALPAGTLNDVIVTNPDATAALWHNAWMADFLDVPQADPFYGYVYSIFRAGITAGCGGGDYCRNTPVTRAQMAVFLLKGHHVHVFPYYFFSSVYIPPACTGVFGDVECTPIPAFAVNWIEELYHEGITGGCSVAPLDYCPGNPVTRAQMAVFLLKAEHGSDYVPPACTGIFADVECTPTPAFAADWIEQLYNEGVTGGCSVAPLSYCPGASVTRGQMAVFLTRVFLSIG